jgi:hypothetical protein
MKTRNLIASLMTLAGLALSLAGCGGGGGSSSSTAPPAQPTVAIVKLATTGTLPAGVTIGGIQADVTYPTSGLTIATSDVAAAGVAVSGAGQANTTFQFPNLNVPGTVSIGMLNANGFQAGEFATLTFHLTAGAALPTLSNFAIVPGAVVNDASTNQPIASVSVVVQGITLL